MKNVKFLLEFSIPDSTSDEKINNAFEELKFYVRAAKHQAKFSDTIEVKKEIIIKGIPFFFRVTAILLFCCFLLSCEKEDISSKHEFQIANKSERILHTMTIYGIKNKKDYCIDTIHKLLPNYVSKVFYTDFDTIKLDYKKTDEYTTAPGDSDRFINIIALSKFSISIDSSFFIR